jgi:hypothetical protein
LLELILDPQESLVLATQMMLATIMIIGLVAVAVALPDKDHLHFQMA